MPPKKFIVDDILDLDALMSQAREYVLSATEETSGKDVIPNWYEDSDRINRKKAIEKEYRRLVESYLFEKPRQQQQSEYIKKK